MEQTNVPYFYDFPELLGPISYSNETTRRSTTNLKLFHNSSPKTIHSFSKNVHSTAKVILKDPNFWCSVYSIIFNIFSIFVLIHLQSHSFDIYIITVDIYSSRKCNINDSKRQITNAWKGFVVITASNFLYRLISIWNANVTKVIRRQILNRNETNTVNKWTMPTIVGAEQAPACDLANPTCNVNNTRVGSDAAAEAAKVLGNWRANVNANEVHAARSNHRS